MSVDDLKDLRLGQRVLVRCNPPNDGYYYAWVRSINSWTNIVGVVDRQDNYKEYPQRLIKIE